MHYVYFIRSLRTLQVYIGSTGKDPQIRLEEHNQSNTFWTRSKKPFELVYIEEYSCKTDALMREKFYKMGFGKAVKKFIVEYCTEKKIRPS